MKLKRKSQFTLTSLLGISFPEIMYGAVILSLIISPIIRGRSGDLQVSKPHFTPERRFKRNLLKKDYKPDDFKLSSAEKNDAVAEGVLNALNLTRRVLSCPFSTFDCGNTDPGSNLSKGSLGVCAVVASGSSILKYRFGHEIDAFDTVFRIGFGPVSKYRAHVGSRTDVMFVRTPQAFLNDNLLKNAIESDYTGFSFSVKDHLPTKFFLSLPISCQKHEHLGKRILKLKLLSHIVCNRRPRCKSDSVSEHLSHWYENFGTQEDFENATNGFLNVLSQFRRVREKIIGDRYKRIYFTHGFEMILSLLHSEFCTFISIYGFSKFPTYHYFDSPQKGKGRRVRPGHVMGMEYFILKTLKDNKFPLDLKAYE